MDATMRDLGMAVWSGMGRVAARDIVSLREYVENFLDAAWVRSEYVTYEAWARGNSHPVLQAKLLHRPLGMNPVVAMLWAAHWWEKEQRSDPSFEPPSGAKRLIPFAAALALTEAETAADFDEPARKHLQERLRAPENVWGAVHECQTFASFAARRESTGLDISADFLRKASRSEIVLSWNGHEVPIQCKVKPPGSGRVISSELFTHLAGLVARDASRDRRRIIVRMTVPDRLRAEDVPRLRAAAEETRKWGSAPLIVNSGNQSFTVRSEPCDVEFEKSDVQVVASRYDAHLKMILSEPVEGTGRHRLQSVVLVEATPNERPWRSLNDSIEAAAKQLAAGPPGFAAIHYVDYHEHFESLRPGALPIRAVINRKIRERRQLAGILVSSEPDLQLPGAERPGRVRAFYKHDRLPKGLSQALFNDQSSAAAHPRIAMVIDATLGRATDEVIFRFERWRARGRAS
jgi:hypothetical protein